MTQFADTYISFDVECTGNDLQNCSLLSVGCCLVRRGADNKFYVDTAPSSRFSVNIRRNTDDETPLTEGGRDFEAATLQWWLGFPDAWAAHRTDVRYVRRAAHSLFKWADDNNLRGNSTLAAWPISFDLPWLTTLYAYDRTDTPGGPFGYDGFCIGSAVRVLRAMGVNTKKLFEGIHNPTPHVALADALEQGEQLVRVLNFLEPPCLSPELPNISED